MSRTILTAAFAGFMVLFLAACGAPNNGNNSSSSAASGASSAATQAAPAAAGVAATATPCSSSPAPVPSAIPNVPAAPAGAKFVTAASGLRYLDLKAGSGPTPQPGQTVTVNYTGWLLNGQKFDSSLDRHQPFSFKLGVGQVIPGWDEGIASMHVGGERRLIIPPMLAYGPGGNGPIPPCSTLVFDVQLLSIGAPTP